MAGRIMRCFPQNMQLYDICYREKYAKFRFPKLPISCHFLLEIKLAWFQNVSIQVIELTNN